jgi:hypothetical protein
MSETYPEYHARVIAKIRERLFARWPPENDSHREMLELNVQFFDRQCSYDEAFAAGEDPADFVDDEIDAAF